MLAFSMEAAAVKGFMNRLLKENIFDRFEVRTVEICQLTRITLSGEVEGSEPRRFAAWPQLRPLVHTIIKEGLKPRVMKIVFSGDAQTNAAIHENASVLFLNLFYENGAVTFTTATAQKNFTLDKTMDAQWDAYITDFFVRSGVAVKVTS